MLPPISGHEHRPNKNAEPDTVVACSSGFLELRTGDQLHLHASLSQLMTKPVQKAALGSGGGSQEKLAEYLLHWLLRPAAGKLICLLASNILQSIAFRPHAERSYLAVVFQHHSIGMRPVIACLTSASSQSNITGLSISLAMQLATKMHQENAMAASGSAMRCCQPSCLCARMLSKGRAFTVNLPLAANQLWSLLPGCDNQGWHHRTHVQFFVFVEQPVPAAGTRFLTPEQRGSRFASSALPPDLAAGSYHVHPALGDSTIHAAAIQSEDPSHGSVPTRVPVSVDAFAAGSAADSQSKPGGGGGGHTFSRTAALLGDGSGVSDMCRAASGGGCFSITGLASKAMPAPPSAIWSQTPLTLSATKTVSGVPLHHSLCKLL